METKRSIGYYIGENTNRFFKIPAYQRGFKWGELNSQKECDASNLVRDILEAMANKKSEYFIQGVTVYENHPEVILIDGQQRTTTLFLLLHLLFTPEETNKYLFYNGQFKLKYEIRERTQAHLKSICLNEAITAESQDEFFMNQALEEMIKIMPKDDNEIQRLKKYILDKVQLFYIEIPQKHATQTFSMLNGSKAFMTADELVKSAFLSEATKSADKNFVSKSLSETMENLKSQIGDEWQTTTLRSRYARQWDKWMYWWNQEEIKAFFDTSGNPMGRLIEYFFKFQNSDGEKVQYSNKLELVPTSFKLFQNYFIKDTITAKKNFNRLHKLQKTFEDLYNHVTTYNHLGLALTAHNSQDYMNVLDYFIKNFKDHEKIKEYTLLSLIGVSKKDIINKNESEIQKKKSELFDLLNSPNVYSYEGAAKEYTFRMLFLLNVFASNKRGVKFEFFYLYNNQIIPFNKYRSLEHIWPKSKVAYQKDQGNSQLFMTDEKGNEVPVDQVLLPKMINRNKFSLSCSEHCIGNLLYLHKHDNSAFNAKLPEDKKLVYFNLENSLYSRNLLHTMSAFAVENWSQEKAIKNIETLKVKTINTLKQIYNYVD